MMRTADASAVQPPPAGKVAQTLLHRLDRLAAVLFGDIPAPDIPPPTLYQEMREGRPTKGGASENYKIMGRVGRWLYRHLEGDASEAALAREEVLNYFASERKEGLMRGEQGANSPHAEMHYAAHLLAYFAGIKLKDREMTKAGLLWVSDFLATCAACAVGGKIFMPGFRVRSGAEPISPVRDLIYQAALGKNVKLSSKRKEDRFFLGAEIASHLQSLKLPGGGKALPEPRSGQLPKLRARMVVEQFEGGGFLATINKIPVKGRSEEVVDWVLADRGGLEDFGRGWKRERPVVDRPVRQRTESPA
ncbi:MAG TPA: hypothetical protein VNW71_07090 [Thermoanaerobaculia bacterium]|nr:hypothetical protein [Thermoanaerobaculia bacterium]